MKGTNIKVLKIGNSIGITIPKPIAEVLDIQIGDTLKLQIDETNRIILDLSKKGP